MNNMGNEVLQIPLADIIPNQFQPRLNFDEKELEELAQSIKEHGIIQPLVLRKMGQKYEIIAGERRFRAATMLGLSTVPAILSNIDDQSSAEVALVENVQRKDLSAIEEARSYKNILDKGYLTQEQLAKKMGISQPAIANKLRLLNLDDSVQQALLDGKISERHARSLLALNNKEDQKEWLDKIINERLTVRQLDMEIKKKVSASEMPFVSITKDVNEIKSKAADLPKVNNGPSTNTFFNFNDAPVNNNANSNEPGKMPNKFFNFLEDESANMNPMGGSSDNSIFGQIPDVIPGAQTVTEPEPVKPDTNKFLDFNQPEEPVIQEETLDVEEDSELETLFDPMDQVELLDPDYEEKKKEDDGLDLKSAINETRNIVDQLNNKGFSINVEEIDLNDKYQIIINIDK